MPHARPATVADLATLTELTRAARAELTPQRGGDLWAAGAPAPSTERLHASLTDPDTFVAAGVFEGEVFGVLVARLTPADPVGLVATIDELYVDPEAREIGLGAALIERTFAWARSRGCAGVDAVVLPGNRKAKNFFEAHGLVARAITVHHRFRAEEAP